MCSSLSSRYDRRRLDLGRVLLVNHGLLLLADQLVHELSDLLAERSKTEVLGCHFCAAAGVLACIFVVGDGFDGEGHCEGGFGMREWTV